MNYFLEKKMLHMITQSQALETGFIPSLTQNVRSIKSGKTHQSEGAIFFVYIDRDYGLVGGAKLTPVSATASNALYRRSMGIALGDKVWECSHVFFDIEGIEELERHDSKAYALTKRFYHDLFEGIREFAMKKGIKYMVTRHDEVVHEELRYAGSWPFVVEMMEPSKDQLMQEVFGVLSMSAQSYDSFRKQAVSTSNSSAMQFVI